MAYHWVLLFASSLTLLTFYLRYLAHSMQRNYLYCWFLICHLVSYSPTWLTSHVPSLLTIFQVNEVCGLLHVPSPSH